MHPVDIATAETLRFIQTHVDLGSRILEVGCGEGELAFALGHASYKVTAIDSDPERIARAQALGIDARVASWPDFDIAAMDAIVFARSLHHISPLPKAIDRARELLKPDGVLLIEDFAVESADERTLNWFKGIVGSEPFASVFQPCPESFVTALLATTEPMDAWERHHTAHGVERFDQMQQLIADRFASCRVESVPYLYRYVVSGIHDADQSAELVGKLLRIETEAHERNAIQLIGRRIVAPMNSSN